MNLPYFLVPTSKVALQPDTLKSRYFARLVTQQNFVIPFNYSRRDINFHRLLTLT